MVRADLSGSLGEMPLPELLAFLEATGASGVIELSGVSPGLVALHRGRVTVAMSDNGPTLQQVFVGSGLTTPDEWWRASAEGHRSGSLADAVVAGGADAAAVAGVLYEQAAGAVFEFLLPGDDTFAYVAGASHPLGTTFSWTADELIADARQRVQAWQAIAASVPSTSLVVRAVRRPPVDPVVLDATEWSVLTALDGERSVADIIREVGLSAFAVCSTLHALRQRGLVQPAAEDQPAG